MWWQNPGVVRGATPLTLERLMLFSCQMLFMAVACLASVILRIWSYAIVTVGEPGLRWWRMEITNKTFLSEATVIWDPQPWEGFRTDLAAVGVKDSECPRSASGNSHTCPAKLEHSLISTILSHPCVAGVPALLLAWWKWEFIICFNTKSPHLAATAADVVELTSTCVSKEW